jgi:hypothetical protein
VPRGIRHAATACLILSAWVGFLAASETWQLFRVDEPTDVSWLSPSGDPLVQRALEEARQKETGALRGMREARALTLVGLSLACALTFVGASRILRPLGFPREGVRRLLASAALAAGVLRTIDGAQMAVVSQRQGVPLAKAFAALHLFSWSASVGVGITVFMTFVIAGGFLLASQYFRSERVKRIVEFRDSHPD